MKATHQKHVLDDLQTFGRLSRDQFTSDRSRYGLDFARRIRELDLHYIIERVYKGGFIDYWIYVGPKNPGQLSLLEAS